MLKTKIFFREILHFQNKKRLEKLCQEYQQLREIFQKNPKYYNDLLCRSYAALNFNAKKSFEIFERDLKIMLAYKSDLLENDCILYENNELKINLHSHPKVISEGLFNISLIYKGKILYTASFANLSDGILLTALQGGLNCKEELKEFTKAFFGLRPLNFIIILLFQFNQILGGKKLFGIKDSFLISKFKRGRVRKGREFIIPNYNEIWQENTKIIQELSSYYELELERKSIEEIPSKKRSMYKKRYEFLDSIKLGAKNES